MEAELFQAVGGWGKWQKITLAITFYANMIGSWQNFAMTFLAPNVPFRCIHPNVTETSTLWPGQCYVWSPEAAVNVPCEKWEYDTKHYSDTLINKWDLVCDREWLISFSKSVYMMGYMASVLIFGQVSDRIGRYPTIIIGYLISSTTMVLSLFSSSMTAFLVFRFLQAFGRAGASMTLFVLLMETVETEKRTRISILGELGWSFSKTTLAFIGYFFRHWFWFQLAITLPMPLKAIPLFFLTESPRWLLMQGKFSRLEKVLQIAASRNGKKFQENIVKRLIETQSADMQNRTLLDLFKTKFLRRRLLITMYLWFVNVLLYYAVAYNTNDMFGNPYLNFLISGLLEFPAFGLLYIPMQRFGRRKVLVLAMLLVGSACLALPLVPSDNTWLMTALSQFGKFCVTASLGLVLIYTGEMFPTVVRNAALGSCSAVARIGSILAPFSRELGKASHPSVPNVLFSLLAVSSGIFTLWLPETKGHNLPDSLDDGEALASNSRRMCS